MLPFLGWLALYVAALWLFRAASRPRRPRASRRALTDDRPHDRRVHEHRDGQALLACAPRGGLRAQRDAGFPGTVHAQMRLVTGFEIVNHVLSMGLIARTAGATLWLWTQGEVGVGAVAAATAMALRLNGISHWVMWEMAALFEHIGTVQDGINTLARPHTVVDRAGREAARRQARRDPLRARDLRLRRQAPGHRRPVACTSGRARRSAWSAAPARASRRSSTCCCASTTSSAAAS